MAKKKNNDPQGPIAPTPGRAGATGFDPNANGPYKGGIAKFDPPPGKASTKPKDPPAQTQQAQQPQQAQGFDPLALQQMWAQVFGPAFSDAAKIGAQAGPDYLQAMTQAIAGSHQSPEAQGQQMHMAQAMASLLQGYAGNQLQQVAAGPSFDQLIQWLQQATGASQLAQGTAEKNIAYGGALQNASAFGVNGGAGAGGAGGALSPQQAAALTQQALSGTQTGGGGGGLTGTTPGNPFLPQQLLQSQGLP